MEGGFINHSQGLPDNRCNSGTIDQEHGAHRQLQPTEPIRNHLPSDFQRCCGNSFQGSQTTNKKKIKSKSDDRLIGWKNPPARRNDSNFRRRHKGCMNKEFNANLMSTSRTVFLKRMSRDPWTACQENSCMHYPAHIKVRPGLSYGLFRWISRGDLESTKPVRARLSKSLGRPYMELTRIKRKYET